MTTIMLSLPTDLHTSKAEKCNTYVHPFWRSYDTEDCKASDWWGTHYEFSHVEWQYMRDYSVQCSPWWAPVSRRISRNKQALVKIKENELLISGYTNPGMDLVKKGYEAKVEKLKVMAAKNGKEARQSTANCFSFYLTLLGNEQHLQWDTLKGLTDSEM